MSPPKALSRAERIERVGRDVILPALELLPVRMGSADARVMLMAIGLQESLLLHRKQLGRGPARGLWQFEPAGVLGVYQHRASAHALRTLCAWRDCEHEPTAIWRALVTDDILAAGVARLLLWTDPHPLPRTEAEGWACYLRLWRPGRPRPEKWARNYADAVVG